MTRGFLIVAMVSFVPGCEIVPMVGSALAQERPLRQYLPEIQERQRFSDIVCFGTILSTQLTTAVVLGARERSEWLAIAHVDRVIKGDLQGRIIQFKYSWDLALPPGEYFGPPLAHFESGIRYVLFLKSDGADLQVAIPTYQMEIQIAAEPPKVQVAESDPGLVLATELVFAVQSARQPAAMATHYFSWAEELIGKRSIPLVKPFLGSSDQLIRYQVAWWLSFRELDSKVIDELTNAMHDESLAAWARSGARDRLDDMAQGRWLP